MGVAGPRAKGAANPAAAAVAGVVVGCAGAGAGAPPLRGNTAGDEEIALLARPAALAALALARGGGAPVRADEALAVRGARVARTAARSPENTLDLTHGQIPTRVRPVESVAGFEHAFQMRTSKFLNRVPGPVKGGGAVVFPRDGRTIARGGAARFARKTLNRTRTPLRVVKFPGERG